MDISEIAPDQRNVGALLASTVPLEAFRLRETYVSPLGRTSVRRAVSTSGPPKLRMVMTYVIIWPVLAEDGLADWELRWRSALGSRV